MLRPERIPVISVAGKQPSIQTIVAQNKLLTSTDQISKKKHCRLQFYKFGQASNLQDFNHVNLTNTIEIPVATKTDI